MKYPRLVSAFLVIILVFFMHSAQSGQTKLDPFSIFRHIGSDNGLPNLRITAIHEDHQGFVWIGTEEGLCRYDGFQMLCYQNDPAQPNSISGNVITSITSDKENRLWIGTTTGLNRLDTQQETFKRFYHVPDNPTSLPGDHVLKITPSLNGGLLVETLGGHLTFLDPEGAASQSLKHETSMQPYYRYHALMQTPDGDIWLGGRNLALHHWDSKNQELNIYEADINTNNKRENDFSFIFKSEKGEWYVGGVDGFYRFLPDSIHFERIFGNTSYDIKENKNGLLWIGTGSGLARFNPATQDITFFRKHPNNPNSLIDNSVNSVLIDQAGNIWAGTSRGISLFAADNQRFRFFYPVSDMEVSPASSLITALYEDDEGRLWIGTEDRGISIWDEARQSIRHLSASNSFLLANHISYFYKDSQENLWIGLWAGMGFHRYNEQTRRWATFRYDPFTRKRDWYNGFYEDSNGDFWLAFWGAQGLKKFDRTRGVFSDGMYYVFAEDSIAALNQNPDTLLNSLSSRLTTAIAEDLKGRLWVGTSDSGLNRMCPERKHIEIFNPQNSPLPSLHITALHKDNNGNIWIGTDKGMAIYHENHGSILPTPEIVAHIRSIAEDDHGRLWIGTTNGLLQYWPVSAKKRHYRRPQGLLTNEFNKAAIKRSDGSLAFGTPEGLLLLHPDDFSQIPSSPTPIITHLDILGERKRNFFALQDTLVLSHKDHYVTLGISCLSYKHPPMMDGFFFKLKGMHGDWIETSGNIISFSNLNPGNYQLFVSQTAESLDNLSPQLVITVKAAFWQTTWFVILLILFISSGIAAVFYNYVHQLKLKNQSAHFEQRLLLSQMNPHFIYNSLSAIQNYIYKNQAKDAGNYLSDFSRLMRNILENSRSEWVSLKKELDTLELYLRLQKLRFPEKLHYKITTAPEIIPSSMLIPPMLIQPFVENAIEHGIMHKQGPGNLTIVIKQHNQYLEVTIMDNGIGIEASQKLKQLNTDQRSFATVISLERMAGLRKSSRNDSNIEVLDRESYDGEPGTVVIQKIPFHWVGRLKIN